MLATWPKMRTSASQRMLVPLPSSLRSNCVSMLMIAPTPLPFAHSRACSGGRDSPFSKSMLMRMLPSPSGTLTFAFQCVSSATSKLSTPGMSSAICAGSLRTSQTFSRGAE
jgi:hypothetical protein